MSNTAASKVTLDQIRETEKTAGELWAALEKKRGHLLKAGIDVFDPANRAQADDLLDLHAAFDSASRHADVLKRQYGSETGRDLFSGRSPSDRLPVPASQPGGALAGTAFANHARETRAHDAPSGGAGLPSILASYLSRPVADGGYRAAFDVTGGGGVASPPMMTSTFSRLPHRPLSVLDLIPFEDVAGLGGESLDYLRQTVYTNAAAVTAHLAAKPESTLSVERASTSLYTVATVSDQIPRQLLAAFGDLESFVSNELGLAVLESCENYALNGTGSGQPTGILNASIGSQAKGGDSTADAIRKAITTLRNAHVTPEAVIMNPSDLETLEMETDANGQYLLGGPVGSAPGSIWRVRVVESTALAAGTGLVGNFALGARRWMGLSRLAWSEAVSDDFAKNAVRFLAETGFGFATLRANHFVAVTGI